MSSILAKALYRRLAPLLDSTSASIIEEAIEHGDFDRFKSSVGEAFLNSFFMEMLHKEIEFDEAD